MRIFLQTLLCLLFTSTSLWGQEITQTIRGKIIDQESNIPLIGANIALLHADQVIGTTTEVDGTFKLENVVIGRHNIEVTYLGYEPLMLSNLLLTAGKELVLNLEMQESALIMDEVVVSAKENVDKTKAINSFATLSARTFSVEETSRYVAASFDPARMAQNYAGVSIGAGSDLFNEIVIRGNAPGGVLWRLEGIEIPNPNHFGSLGNSGGAISMLSSSTLSNSDFYTGAFPSEFGNAISGVFDLKMRNGNNEKREYSFMLGALGVEAAMEGPFTKGGKASYLINYRYSTLALLELANLNPTGDVLPTYQDLSFKINMPTENAGVFGIFGLAGNNLAATYVLKDSLEWESPDDQEGFEETQDVGTIGLSHRILLGSGSYLHSVATGSFQREKSEGNYLDKDYVKHIEATDKTQQTTFRFSTMYHKKINAKNSLRIGGIISKQDYSFEYNDAIGDEEILTKIFDNNANTSLIQAYGQIKHRFNEKTTLNAGLHYSLMTLNNKMSVEPRAAISYQVAPKQRIAFSVGLHSKMETLALYAIEGEFFDGYKVSSKKHLGLTKSLHNVLGYDITINPKLRVKAEVYYQHLFDVPVSKNVDEKFTTLNTYDFWDYFGLQEATSDGKGRNYGLDLTIERFFSDKYYFMVTGSLFDSKFSPQDGKWYNTRFNGNYQLNTLGGMEFPVGKNKKNLLGINGKIVMSGGNRYTPVNLEASIAANDDIYFEDQAFEARSGVYYRFDIGFSYKMNRKNMTHTIMFDIQNLTNRENIYSLEYNPFSQALEAETQTGFFPFVNYRMEF